MSHMRHVFVMSLVEELLPREGFTSTIEYLDTRTFQPKCCF